LSTIILKIKTLPLDLTAVKGFKEDIVNNFTMNALSMPKMH